MKKELREKVYNKLGGRCAYCGNKIKYKDMQVDHIIPKRAAHIYSLERGPGASINDFDNLHPSCRRCNFYKSDMDIETFRGQMKTLHERIRKIFINKLGEDHRIIKVKPFNGVFYFESEKGKCVLKKQALKIFTRVQYAGSLPKHEYGI